MAAWEVLKPHKKEIEDMRASGETYDNIGKIYGYCGHTIRDFLKVDMQNMERVCAVCGKKFVPKTNRNIVCSKECCHKRRRQLQRELYRKKKGGVVEAQINYQTPQKVTEALSHEDKVKYRLIREYSFDDNTDLIRYTEEGRSPEWIAKFFMREIKSVEDQLADLRESGKYERIRNIMQIARDNPQVARW